MSKKKRPENLGLRTLIAQARTEVTSLSELIDKFEKKLSVLGRISSTFKNCKDGTLLRLFTQQAERRSGD